MKLLSLAILASTILMTGCSTSVNRSQKSGSLDVRVRSDLQAEMDVDMTKKIAGTAHHTKLLGIFNIKSSQNYADGVAYDGGDSGFSLFGGGIVEETKSAAAYNAVVPNKADVLVAPQYLIKVKSYFFGAWKEVSTQVSGYAGRIRNIRQSPRQAGQVAGN
ncbi:MAG: hypothetical protein H0V66_03190 [Bdellovibrionales bacterium]|nr:hypothetical protein [Bdellovibrionales bacterium]